MEQDEKRFYDEDCNFLYVKTENDGQKFLDHVFIHKDKESGRGFMAHFKTYNEDLPIEVYSIKKIQLPELNDIDHTLCQSNYSDVTSWKRIRIKAALPTQWKILFEKLMSIINSGNTQ